MVHVLNLVKVAEKYMEEEQKKFVDNRSKRWLSKWIIEEEIGLQSVRKKYGPYLLFWSHMDVNFWRKKQNNFFCTTLPNPCILVRLGRISSFHTINDENRPQEYVIIDKNWQLTNLSMSGIILLFPMTDYFSIVSLND